MQIIRHIALGLCLLCAAAGIIRIFWPDNHFKPVINTVLLLYIVTSVFQTGSSTDWESITDGIKNYSDSSASMADLSDYQEQLGLEVSIKALETLFVQKGIHAQFQWDEDTLHVEVRNQADWSAAQELLEANSGTLPFVLEVKGGE